MTEPTGPAGPHRGEIPSGPTSTVSRWRSSAGRAGRRSASETTIGAPSSPKTRCRRGGRRAHSAAAPPGALHPDAECAPRRDHESDRPPRAGGPWRAPPRPLQSPRDAGGADAPGPRARRARHGGFTSPTGRGSRRDRRARAEPRSAAFRPNSSPGSRRTGVPDRRARSAAGASGCRRRGPPERLGAASGGRVTSAGARLGPRSPVRRAAEATMLPARHGDYPRRQGVSTNGSRTTRSPPGRNGGGGGRSPRMAGAVGPHRPCGSGHQRWASAWWGLLVAPHG